MSVQRWNVSLQKVGNGEYRHQARRSRQGHFVLYADHRAELEILVREAIVRGFCVSTRERTLAEQLDELARRIIGDA